MTDSIHSNKLLDRLKQIQPSQPMRSREEFWSDFNARARLCMQETGQESNVMPLVPRWAIAGVTAMLMFAVITMKFAGQAEGGGYSTIEHLEVTAPHSAVLVMNDEDSQSTILWVVDMDNEPGELQ